MGTLYIFIFMDKIVVFYIVIIFGIFGGNNNSDSYGNDFHAKYYINVDAIQCVSQAMQVNQWNSIQGRPARVNKQKYNNSNYGIYRSSVYVVKQGDTLFYIAWITGNHYLDLASNNNIKNINLLKVGQVLQVKNNKKLFPYCIQYSKKVFFYLKNFIFFIKNQYFLKNDGNVPICINTKYNEDNILFSSKALKLKKFNRWHWPTHGKVINTFSDTEKGGGNKGIDISGVLGQPVVAATHGKVVYVGNALKGYGNLIIIKHNGNYLSAYAHNDTVLVSEQQIVQVGDIIATMGNSGTNEIKLHFEIRYKGKSVDPLYFLPKI